MKITDFKKGDKLRFYYGKDNDNNTLYHVRGFVDGIISARFWCKSKQRWEYRYITLNQIKIYEQMTERSIFGLEG